MLLRPTFNSLFWKLFAGLCFVIFCTGVGVWIAAYSAHVKSSGDVNTVDWRLGGRKAVATALSVYHYAGRSGLESWLVNEEYNRMPVVYVMDKNGHDLAGRDIPKKSREMLSELKAQSTSTGGFHKASRDKFQANLPMVSRVIELDGQPYEVFAVRTQAYPIHLIPPQLYHFPTTVAFIIAILVTIFVSGVLAFFYTRSLGRLNHAMQRFSRGELDLRISDTIGQTDAEVASLAHAFDNMAARIEQLVTRQRRLFHDVSHEVRSPLARIDVALALARRDPVRVPTSLDRIEKEVVAIDSLIEALLTYARLDTNIRLEMSPTSVSEIVNEVAENVGYEAQKKNVSVNCNIQTDRVITINPQSIARALENITRNALRFSPEGTSIDLTCTEKDNRVLLRCKDAGPGVNPQELATLFEPFVRGNDQATGSGFGLGLAIARRAVLCHGGNITARNVQPSGLEITIELHTDGTTSSN